MASKFLQAYIANARYDCERMLPSMVAHQLDFNGTLRFCQGYRVMGIGLLFMFGDADALQRYLHKSGRAFLHFLAKAQESVQITSRAKPFFDSIAARDLQGAQEIAERLRKSRSEVEYEEDFLFVHFLSTRFFLHQSDADEERILERYEQALAGSTDPRLDACRALFQRDEALFNDSLHRFLEDVDARNTRLADREAISQEILATEGYLSVEGLALVTLAELSGMGTLSDYLLIPSLARLGGAPGAPPESWMTAD